VVHWWWCKYPILGRNRKKEPEERGGEDKDNNSILLWLPTPSTSPSPT